MTFFRAAILATVGFLPAIALAQVIPGIPVGQQWDPTNPTGSFNTWVYQQLNPNTAQLAQKSTFRNLLDNGAGNIQQRGTSAATCGGTSGPPPAGYAADRWACEANVASDTAVIMTPGVTSSPSPPPGFQYSQTLNRGSGSTLGQPICAEQELTTSKSVATQGQLVDFSVYAEALSSLAADNGNLVNLYILTGTDTAGGLGGSIRGSKGMTTTGNHAFTAATTGILTYNSNGFVAGQPIIFSSSGSLPAGFSQNVIYYVSTTNLATNTFSVAATYAAALAGTVIAPSNTGSGTQTVYFPYITPAWTTLAVYGPASVSGALGNGQGGQGQTSAAQAFGQVTAAPYTLSSSVWTRISTGPVLIPTGTTEVAALICTWPTRGVTGSATDGFAFTGAQFEIMQPLQTTPSPYEFKDDALETQDAYRFYYVVYDQAAGTILPAVGTLLTTTTCQLTFPFPAPMDIAPTYAAIGTLATSTFKIYVAADTSTLASTFASGNTGTTLDGSLTATLTTASTAGWACTLVGQTAQAVGFSWSADF